MGFLSRSLDGRLPVRRFFKAGAPDVRSRFGDRSYSNVVSSFAAP